MKKKVFILMLLALSCLCGNAQRKNKRITDIDKLETRFDGTYFVVENCKLDLYDFNRYFKEHPEFQLISKKSYTKMEFGLYDTYITSFKYTIRQAGSSGPKISPALVKVIAVSMGVIEVGMLGALLLRYAGSSSNCEITVIAKPFTAGLATSDYTYYKPGESCTVRAIPRSGHRFMCWTENEEVVSRDADYTFTVTSSRTLEAVFY